MIISCMVTRVPHSMNMGLNEKQLNVYTQCQIKNDQRASHDFRPFLRQF